MKAEERRKEVIRRLQGAGEPLSASRLASEFGVSRQIIVQDIALIRASGLNVTALSRGYVLEKKDAFSVCSSCCTPTRMLKMS